MTLHEAIEMILQEFRSAMTSKQIANIINERKLYLRKDGSPVSASQVTARVDNYDKIFSKDHGVIKLLKDDNVSLALQNYKNEISSLLKTPKFSGFEGGIKSLLELLENLKSESISNDESDIEDFDNEDFDFKVSEPTAPYGVSQSKDNLEIAFRLCSWYLSQDTTFRMVFTEQFVSVLSGLHWFKKGHQALTTDIQDSNHFILKIVNDNPNAAFWFNSKQSQLDKDIDIEYENYLVDQLNYQIGDLINIYNDIHIFNDDFESEYNAVKTKIIIPPLNKRSWNNYSTAFEPVLKELNYSRPRFDKMIFIVAASNLSSSQKKDEEAREKLVESRYLDTVVLFPNKIIENSSATISFLIFDFQKKKEEVFFFDATDIFNNDPKAVVDIINRKTEIADVSKMISIKTVYYNTYSLFPKEFVFNPNKIEVKEENQQFSLMDLVLNRKSGVRFKNRNSLYSGGEYKLIRTSEIDKDALYFQPKESMIGIDHDEILDLEKSLISGGIVVSGFNKKLKASVLSNEETYALGQDVYWLKLNDKLVVDAYLVKEFSKAYVTKQVKYYSKGSTISRLYLKDLLKIQLQIPSVEKQREILLTDLNKGDKDNDVTDKELDFIKTLKHTLKQPASSLGNDFSSLRIFINNKVIDRTPLENEETIVPVFLSDTPEQIAVHTLTNTLDRMARAVTDIDYILDQAVKVIEITKPINKENINLKIFLQNFISEYPNITIKVKGKQVDILADRKQLRILVHNFINNAIKHGFTNQVENPTFWLEIKPKDTLSIQLSIRNNGVALSPEFTLKDFLAKGATSNADVGSGFGGFLIGRILENHKGEIALTKKVDFGILKHNVEFIITLPK